jgi:uncharacterized protein (TIGR02271 family)
MPRVTQEYDRWQGFSVHDTHGAPVGSVDDVYVNANSQRPSWIVVRGRSVTNRDHLVPVAGMVVSDNSLELPFTVEQVDAAPGPDADGTLSAEQEQRLYEHYGIEEPEQGRPAPAPVTPSESRPPVPSAPDDAMTRSEEELVITTVSRPAEIVRLRKQVVDDEVTITVPVRREEVRLERIPFTGDEASAARPPDAVTGEGMVEITLFEEEVEVTKRVVPRERIRLEKEIVTEDRDVTEDVRKEQIDIEHLPPEH